MVTVFRARGVRLRMWWTTVLVLIALAGAGLAVAADRPHNPLHRPELTWRADRDAQLWIHALADGLALIDQDLVDLSEQGRAVLGTLLALDLEAMNNAIADGNEISVAVDAGIEQLQALREETDSAVEEWRLGSTTRDLLDQLSAATVSAQQVSAFWRGLASDAQSSSSIVDALLRHDALVSRATTAGRQARWDDALEFVRQAGGPLGDATEVRDDLAENVNVGALDDLLGRQRAYDEALTALYSYIRDTGRQEGEAFEALRNQVEIAKAGLPTDTTAMRMIVSETAGPSLTEALVSIEQAHGDILAALSAVDEADPA